MIKLLSLLIITLMSFKTHAGPAVIWGSPFPKVLGGGLSINAVDTTATCAAAIAGSLRWNGSNVQICNGAAWANIATGAAGANTALSNLASTAVNADINPASNDSVNLGQSGTAFLSIYASNVATPAVFSAANQALALSTANNGAGNSGNMTLTVGTATGTQGSFKFLKSGVASVAGQAWIASGTDGSGYWATNNAKQLQATNIATTAPSNGQILAYNSTNTNWAPVAASAVAGSQTLYLWNGAFALDSSNFWSLTSTSFADFVATGTPALTQQYNQNFGTITAAASTLPGITFTAPANGTVYFVVHFHGSLSAVADADFKLVDGSGTLIGGTSPVASTNAEHVLVGYLDVVQSSSYTVKIQGKSSASTLNIKNGSNAGLYSLDFSMSYAVANSNSGSGTVTSVSSGSGLLGGTFTGVGTISADTGTTANKLVQLNAAAQIPAVDGFLLTNINAVKLQSFNIATNTPTSAQIMTWNATVTAWRPETSSATGTITLIASGAGLLGGTFTSGGGTLSADSGTTANKLLKLDTNAQIPAVDGFLLTNINAVKLQTFNLATNTPTSAQVLTFNSTTTSWRPETASAGSATVTNMQVFTASGTFTLPAGAGTGTKFKFTVTGGGGGGGEGGVTNDGGGGGAGGTAIYVASGQAGSSTVAVTIGAAGSAGTGASGNVDGGAGGNSTIVFNSVTVTGTGGAGGVSAATSSAGGLGGTPTNGTINVIGGDGSYGGQPGVGVGVSIGGGSIWGPGSNGAAGKPFGSGGAGGYGNGNGIAGKIGVVMIEWTL